MSFPRDTYTPVINVCLRPQPSPRPSPNPSRFPRWTRYSRRSLCQGARGTSEITRKHLKDGSQSDLRPDSDWTTRYGLIFVGIRWLPRSSFMDHWEVCIPTGCNSTRKTSCRNNSTNSVYNQNSVCSCGEVLISLWQSFHFILVEIFFD